MPNVGPSRPFTGAEPITGSLRAELPAELAFPESVEGARVREACSLTCSPPSDLASQSAFRLPLSQRLPGARFEAASAALSLGLMMGGIARYRARGGRGCRTRTAGKLLDLGAEAVHQGAQFSRELMHAPDNVQRDAPVRPKDLEDDGVDIFKGTFVTVEVGVGFGDRGAGLSVMVAPQRSTLGRVGVATVRGTSTAAVKISSCSYVLRAPGSGRRGIGRSVRFAGGAWEDG